MAVQEAAVEEHAQRVGGLVNVGGGVGYVDACLV